MEAEFDATNELWVSLISGIALGIGYLAFVPKEREKEIEIEKEKEEEEGTIKLMNKKKEKYEQINSKHKDDGAEAYNSNKKKDLKGDNIDNDMAEAEATKGAGVVTVDEDSFVKKMGKLSNLLGISEEEIREAVRDGNAEALGTLSADDSQKKYEQYQRGNNKGGESMSLFRKLDWLFFFIMLIFSFVALHHYTNGAFVNTLAKYFPREFTTLGLQEYIPKRFR